MQLIITDVTEMHGNNFCVAGWGPQARRMVRPLPNGRNWTAWLLRQHNIIPGATIDVVPTGRPHQSAFPHRTEDTVVDPARIRHVNAGPIDWFGANAPPAHNTVSAAFNNRIAHNSLWNNVTQGVHVPVGTPVGSLAAVELPRKAVRLVVQFNKLRVILDDGGARYNLPVSSWALKTAWRNGGLIAAKQALPRTPRFHIRLGLARAFGNQPVKCYLMVNGIHG